LERSEQNFLEAQQPKLLFGAKSKRPAKEKAQAVAPAAREPILPQLETAVFPSSFVIYLVARSLDMDFGNLASSNHLQPSVSDPPIHQRQSSTSSSDSADSSRRQPRKAIHSNRRTTAASALHPIDDDNDNDHSDSRRETNSTMRAPTTLDGPVTYTPTTHRISKAKKGKRVHACEFPGCNKVSLCHDGRLRISILLTTLSYLDLHSR
jgi:hypothetical protein